MLLVVLFGSVRDCLFFLLYLIAMMFHCQIIDSAINSLLGRRHVKQRVEAKELPWLLIVILCQSRPNARKSAAFFFNPNPTHPEPYGERAKWIRVR